MRLSKSWIVAQKDFSVFRKNKYIFYSIVAMPLLFGIVIPLGLLLSLPADNPAALAQIPLILNLITTYFVILAVILPTVIASYSFVGEKVEKSLEPLLATPTTDSELLFGKSIAALLPSLGAILPWSINFPGNL
jgi:ABC-2 type transport system permease protein